MEDYEMEGSAMLDAVREAIDRAIADGLEEAIDDSAHEYAESHADVIYPMRAHLLIANTSMDERRAAEDEARDLGAILIKSTYDDIGVAIARFILIRRFLRLAKKERCRMREAKR